MTTIRFNDNTELTVEKINGIKTFYQGANRDSLSFFIKKQDYSLAQIDEIFEDTNKCSKIKVIDGVQEFIYHDYTLKVGIKTEREEPSVYDNSEPVMGEEMIVVTLAQKSYMEKTVSDVPGRTEQLEQTVGAQQLIIEELLFNVIPSLLSQEEAM